MTPPVTKDNESDVLIEFTFELRKKVEDLSDYLACFNTAQEHSRFEMSIGLVAENSRFFYINAYEKGSELPTFQMNCELKEIIPIVKLTISKLNFAWAHGAKVIFTASEDKMRFTAAVHSPKNPRQRNSIIENFKLLDQTLPSSSK